MKKSHELSDTTKQLKISLFQVLKAYDDVIIAQKQLKKANQIYQDLRIKLKGNV